MREMEKSAMEAIEAQMEMATKTADNLIQMNVDMEIRLRNMGFYDDPDF